MTDMDPMEIKDPKIKVLSSLSESCWREYDTRRQYEWKVNFALWAGFGIIAGFSIKENFELEKWVWIIIAVVFCVYIVWQVGLRNSNRLDQSKRHFYDEKIRCQLKIYLPEDLNNPPKTSSKFLLLNWSHGSQIFITGTFLILLGLILTTPKKETDSDSYHKHHPQTHMHYDQYKKHTYHDKR
jgi:hypothetical protein